MSKTDPFTDFQRLSQDADQLAHNLAEFKEELNRVLEQNAELIIENKHLRNRLNEVSQASNNQTAKMLPSRRNLEKLYDEGYHICNMMYGARRDNNDPCTFCTNIIYGSGDRLNH